MINASDFVKLPYTPDLTEGGIAYAIRSLSYNQNQMSGSLYSRLRRIVGNTAVELAFRRYLNQQAVPYEVKEVTPFSNANHYDVSLGGHRCDIKTYITSKRNQIISMRQNPELVLETLALIPDDEVDAANHLDQDLYFFAFLLGLTTNSMEDIQKAVQAEQRTFLIHPLRSDWARPDSWAPLERLTLKSECPTPLTVEIGGLDADRNFISEGLLLNPLTRTFAKNQYYSLSYVQTDIVLPARLGLHCARMRDVYLIQPHEWGNIWIYGMEIWLTGYMAHAEFRRKADHVFAGSKVFQYSKTQSRSFSVPVANLYAIERLIDQTKNWKMGNKFR